MFLCHPLRHLAPRSGRLSRSASSLADRAFRRDESREASLPLDGVVSLCRSRGVVFPSSATYGVVSNAYDYGPLGAALKRNVAALWWREFVETSGCGDRSRIPPVVGMDSSVIANPRVWHSSGHVSAFSDPP